MPTTRRLAAVIAAGALTVSLAACATSERGGDAQAGATGGTMVFGAAGAPKNFDPIFNDDGESFRPIRQMYDTLITYKPGTTELSPGLATAWESTPDGKQWTFTVRQGVTFSDGTPLDAAAVCANFDRWANMQGDAAQSNMIYYADVFEGFKGAGGIYEGCQANGDKAVMTLSKNKGAFPAAFGLTAFSISSPAAMQQYDANNVTQSGDSFSYPAYATDHPTGTGAFKFESYDRTANTITLVRNDQYWGEKAKLDKLVFRVIPDENARKQELTAGTIDGYDLPSPADYASLKSAGQQVLIRDPFNVLYMGINTKNNPALQKLEVRQALAYAIDRQALVQTKLPEGAEVATQFMPDTVAGFASDVQQYPYDPQKAKDLLAAAGATNLTLNFYYPTEVSRPYMPNPTDIFQLIAENLRQVGITVNPVPRPWNGGFKDDVQTAGKQDLHLLGWTGDYNDAGNFVGTFFGREKPEFGPEDPAMYAEINAADANPDQAAKQAAYEQANRDIMAKYLPAVPISSSPPAIVVSKAISGLVPSPLTDERYNTVSKTQS
jgi:peptide/nickel transport system substrate-binding protein